MATLTPLQKRFSATYDTLVKRANVAPKIYSLTSSHNIYQLAAESKYSNLNGFFLAPEFMGKIIYCPDDTYAYLFSDLELSITSEHIGMIISWQTFHHLIDDCKNAGDEAGEHTFRYLLSLLDKTINEQPNSRLLGLINQTIEFTTPTPFIPRLVKK